MAGGEGSDQFRVEMGSGQWQLDLRRGTWSGTDYGEFDVSGFDRYSMSEADLGTRVDVTGSTGADDIAIEGASLGAVHLGRGDDKISVYGPPVRGLIVGGKGEDTLMASLRARRPSGSLSVDLASGRFGSASGRSGRLRGIENVTADSEGSLRLVGDRHDNRLEWLGCKGGLVRGGAGNDQIVYRAEAETFCKHVPGLRGYGGTGNDLLIGGPKADLLAGDRGKDRALGRAGSDRCPAVERRSSC